MKYGVVGKTLLVGLEELRLVVFVPYLFPMSNDFIKQESSSGY
jgi:hypothetical protein